MHLCLFTDLIGYGGIIIEKSIDGFDPFLSQIYFSDEETMLPFFSYLQLIRA